ncbi:MAG TPA: glycosyl hydrolase-related protein [Vicinamibacterales bacterium]|nr:glycosyl hydrolase-related protein [Vicinamibacterales bacterium]
MLDIHVVSHTHWDREWYLTHEQFRFRLIALIDRLLDLLDSDPSYRYFHLDGQTIVLEDYLEIRPEQEPRLRAAIAAGRILIGPWYVMPDEFLVSGESLVRNLLRGHRLSREFGSPMPVGYLPDLFGHVGQMPQIWRQVGLDNTILWRGFGGRDAEYWWTAPDGSRVLMMHLPPEGYCNATRLVFDPGAMMARAAEKVGYERARTRTGQALLMNGVDHVEPHGAIPGLIERLSAQPDQRAHHSTLPAYVAAVRAAVETGHPPLETVAGELRGGTDYANLLPGVLSARVYLKQQNADVEALLESYAEPLALFASIASVSRYPAGELRHAWKTLLQNHPHDSICGCSIDAVHEENMTRFARARQVAAAVVQTSLDAVADSVAPAPAGAIRMIAVNTDSVERQQVVEGFIDLPIESAEPWRTVDAGALDRPVTFWPRTATIAAVRTADGAPVDFQILGERDVIHHEMSRYETPWALHARRIHAVWWAPSLPACGYAAFDFLVSEQSAATPCEPQVGAIENEHLAVAANRDGTFEVVDRRTGAVYHRVAALENAGDVGDEYNYCPPTIDGRLTNADARVTSIARLVEGPLRATLRTDLELPVPRGATADRSRRASETVPVRVTIEATLDRASPRVAFTVVVDNRASDHRLRLIVPTGSARVATARADTAFDVVTRPARQRVPDTITNEAPVSSAPVISVVDAGDSAAGATLIAKGLMEYEILEGEPSIALTLIRAVGDLSRNDLMTRPSGHAGPPVATPGAQCHGVHRFEVAFQPRGGARSAGSLIASARAHNLPPRVVAVRAPSGTAPLARSFMRIDWIAGGAVLSALKQAENRATVIVRLFNPDDGEARGMIVVDAPVERAFAVNLLEERQSELPIHDGAIPIALGPHQIGTIEIVPRPRSG